MSQVAAFISRYRWELTPLLAVTSVGLFATLLGLVVDEAQALRGTLSLGIALLLASALRLVRREGRPLLAVLWLVVIVAELASAVSMMTRQFLVPADVTPTQLGLWHSAIGFLSLAIVIPLAAGQAKRGMRFAILVAAAYLAPTHLFGFVDFIVGFLGTDMPLSVLPPWNALIASPLAFVAVGLIAFSFHHAETMARRTLNRHILYLLGLAAVSHWAGFAVPAVVGSIAAGKWLSALGFLLLGSLAAVVQMGLVLGLVLLLGMLFVSRSRRTQAASG